MRAAPPPATAGGGESAVTVASAGRIRAGPAARDAPAPRREDAQLIREAQRGSEEAIERLFRMHWPRAWRAAYLVAHDSAAAEGITQEAFLAAMRALDRFDRRRPFAPWLHRIVVNRAIDFTRTRNLRLCTRGVAGSRPVALHQPRRRQGARGQEHLRAVRTGRHKPIGVPARGRLVLRGTLIPPLSAGDENRAASRSHVT